MLTAVARLGAHAAAGASTGEEQFLAAVSPDERPEVARLVRTIGTPEAFGLLDQDLEILFAGGGLLQHGNRQLMPARFIEGLAVHRSILAGIHRVVIPKKGLRLLTRRGAFHRLRLERAPWDARMIVYVDRYADLAARTLVKRAVLLKARVQVWADISLSGVLFARSIAAVAKSSFTPFRMSPQNLDWASLRFPVSDEELKAIDENLKAEPDAPLAETLRAVRDRRTWSPSSN